MSNKGEMTEEQVQAAIDENVRLGYFKDNGDGTYSLTDAGINRVNQMGKKPEIVK